MTIIKYVIFGMFKYVGMIFDNISKRGRCILLVLNCDVVYIIFLVIAMVTCAHANIVPVLAILAEARVCDRRGVFNNQVFKIDIYI